MVTVNVFEVLSQFATLVDSCVVATEVKAGMLGALLLVIFGFAVEVLSHHVVVGV